MGQSSATATPLGSAVRVEYMPHPRDMVQIRGGTPYTVPTGRRLVLTALGNIDGGVGSTQVIGVLVNGQREAVTNNTSSPSMTSLPVGLAASAGDVVELAEVYGSQELSKTRAWGYLAAE